MTMASAAVLDRAFHVIVRQMIETGRAPHFTELAAALRCDIEDGRQTLHRVIDAFVPSWLYPETDYVASFSPFSNVPTQYRISVAGQQKWYAQCGFESLAVTWLFPGQVVRVDAPCLDCGQPMILEMEDGSFLRVEPPGIIGHLNQSWVLSKSRLPFL
jgi:Alkylmercury lyase